jgi:hypothetical protein
MTSHNFFASNIKSDGTVFVFSRSGMDSSISISELSPSNNWHSFSTGILNTYTAPANFSGGLDDKNRYYLLYRNPSMTYQYATIEEGKSPKIIITSYDGESARTQVSASPDNLLHFLLQNIADTTIYRLLPNQTATTLVPASAVNFEVLPARNDTRLLAYQDPAGGTSQITLSQFDPYFLTQINRQILLLDFEMTITDRPQFAYAQTKEGENSLFLVAYDDLNTQMVFRFFPYLN